MAGLIEDYAVVGGMQSVALIGTGSHVPLVQTALSLGDHATEHRRGPRDERRIVPG